jgi:hypothetical protein
LVFISFPTLFGLILVRASGTVSTHSYYSDTQTHTPNSELSREIEVSSFLQLEVMKSAIS